MVSMYSPFMNFYRKNAPTERDSACFHLKKTLQILKKIVIHNNNAFFRIVEIFLRKNHHLSSQYVQYMKTIILILENLEFHMTKKNSKKQNCIFRKLIQFPTFYLFKP
jgi:hypothetical protein